MAEAFLQVLLDNLSSLINGEIGLILGVDKEMQKLSSTLTTIQAVLEDAEDKQVKSKHIRNWLRKLNDLAFEIDDILDECATKVSKMQHKNSKASSYSPKEIHYRRKIGRRMKEVAGKLDDVAAEREKFHLREMVVETQKLAEERETGSFLNEPQSVFGRDGEKDKIVEILVNQVEILVNQVKDEHLSVLPIIGMGGLGKTTLAQLVFNDPRVTGHFDIKLWVCVSDNFDVKALIKNIIRSAKAREHASDLEPTKVTGDVLDVMPWDALQQELLKLLNNKRYLLILDDVWNEDQDKWEELKSVIACGSRGASIVVTTRLRRVADIMTPLPVHSLKGLSEEHCWLLFKHRAFGQKTNEYRNLEPIGRRIVKKCVGVPLAAKALGSLLRFKREEKEWLHVDESKIWKLSPEESLILPALRLSYHHLPLDLRQCFAYCALFPKGYAITKEELIFLWMAHGCISSNGIMEVEDVGNGVLHQLVSRSLLQQTTSLDGNTGVMTNDFIFDLIGWTMGDKFPGAQTFMMHDLVHDLAQSIMDNKLPGAQAEERSDRSAPNNNRIRHVDLGSRYVVFPSSIRNEADICFTLKNFNRMRMLNASRMDIAQDHNRIDGRKVFYDLNLAQFGNWMY